MGRRRLCRSEVRTSPGCAAGGGGFPGSGTSDLWLLFEGFDDGFFISFNPAAAPLFLLLSGWFLRLCMTSLDSKLVVCMPLDHL